MTPYQLFCKIYRKLFLNDEVVVHKISEDAPWALVSYIPFALTHWYDDTFLDEHQSRREMFVIDKVLREEGYNVYNISYSSQKELPNKNFRIIFGLEPVFCRASEKYPEAHKIYYATGAYVLHQNEMIKKLTDAFNLKNETSIPYRRTVKMHDSAYLADTILQIGSHYTIETYPSGLREKITLIHQSSQAVKTHERIDYAKENEYFFMSSSGNILKGIPQIIGYFSKHLNLTLHIVGPLEDDVINSLRQQLTPNIVLHGFMNVNSVEYLDIVRKCNYMIYPSGSEGGVPGAVLNSMKNGLIPICSKWAAFDEIDNYGFLIKDVTETEIERGIMWSLSMSADVILQKKKDCAEYVSSKYNLKQFEKEFREFIKTAVN